MKSDLYTAIAQIAAERGIPREAVLSSVEHALKTVYKKMANTEEEVDVDDRRQHRRDAQSLSIKQVVDEVEDPLNEMLAGRGASTYAPTAQVGDTIRIERTPENFGRIAAQTAKQVVLQRIRDYERDTVYEEFADRQGEVINGIVQRADSARGHRRARQGRGGDARARAGADRALPARPADQGLPARGQQGSDAVRS